MRVGIDNDILHKGACYGLLFKFIRAISVDIEDVGVLGEAKYVLRDKLNKANIAGNREKVIDDLIAFISQVTILEPSAEELRLAANLEYAAQRTHLNLDSGESQLCAIVIRRACSKLVTGDKRAIIALESILIERNEATLLASKVVCLEQILLKLLEIEDPSAIRKAVCAEPSVDKSLTNCFSCYGEEVGKKSWIEGLQSYIGNLRKEAEIILATQ